MREHNIYQDMEAARMNAVQSINEDPRIKHIIYGERKTFLSPSTIYKKSLIFYHDESYTTYIDTNPAEVLYVIHSKEEE